MNRKFAVLFLVAFCATQTSQGHHLERRFLVNSFLKTGTNLIRELIDGVNQQIESFDVLGLINGTKQSAAGVLSMLGINVSAVPQCWDNMLTACDALQNDTMQTIDKFRKQADDRIAKLQADIDQERSILMTIVKSAFNIPALVVKVSTSLAEAATEITMNMVNGKLDIIEDFKNCVNQKKEQ